MSQGNNFFLSPNIKCMRENQYLLSFQKICNFYKNCCVIIYQGKPLISFLKNQPNSFLKRIIFYLESSSLKHIACVTLDPVTKKKAVKSRLFLTHAGIDFHTNAKALVDEFVFFSYFPNLEYETKVLYNNNNSNSNYIL